MEKATAGVAGLSEGAARRSAGSGTPTNPHMERHIWLQVRWVHPDSPNQPLDIHSARFPVNEKRATNGERPGAGGDMLLKMKSKDDSTRQGLTDLTSNMNNRH